MYELLVWKRRVQPAAATPSSCLVHWVSRLPVFWMLWVVVGQAGEVVVVAAAPREHVLLLLLVPRVVPRDVLVVHVKSLSGEGGDSRKVLNEKFVRG